MGRVIFPPEQVVTRKGCVPGFVRFAVYELVSILWDGVVTGWQAADFAGRLRVWRETIAEGE